MFHTKTCIWKSRLQHDNHFISVSLWKEMPVVKWKVIELYLGGEFQRFGS